MSFVCESGSPVSVLAECAIGVYVVHLSVGRMCHQCVWYVCLLAECAINVCVVHFLLAECAICVCVWYICLLAECAISVCVVHLSVGRMCHLCVCGTLVCW